MDGAEATASEKKSSCKSQQKKESAEAATVSAEAAPLDDEEANAEPSAEYVDAEEPASFVYAIAPEPPTTTNLRRLPDEGEGVVFVFITNPDEPAPRFVTDLLAIPTTPPTAFMVRAP